jgi:hypothetical protein
VAVYTKRDGQWRAVGEQMTELQSLQISATNSVSADPDVPILKPARMACSKTN